MLNDIPVYCVSLKKRKDRRDSVDKEFKRVGVEYKFWDAVDGSKLIIPDDSPKKSSYNAKGILGCTLSHYTLIKHAEKYNYPAICVFEDDVTFSDNIKEIIQDLDNFSWDIFYLGGHYDEYGKEVVKITGLLHKCNNVGGTYGYIMKKSVYRYVIDNLNYRFGADEFFATHLQKKFKCLAYVPFIVAHNDGDSDVALNYVRYNLHRNFNKMKIKYITFNSLEKYGRLGNQLFEIAGVIGLAHKYNAIPIFPTGWTYRNYFNVPDEYFKDMEYDKRVVEKVFHYIPDLVQGQNCEVLDVQGTLQSEKYFEEIKDDIKSFLMPTGVEYKGEWSVGIHIRRGDYVNNPNYVHYGPEYYYSAIEKFFNDDKYVFHVCSEDYDYAKEHFGGTQFIVEKRTAIEDFMTLCGCRNHIIPNSTFSWWAAYLSNSKLVIRPPKIFDGKLAQTHLEKDYWFSEWTEHNGKIDLSDVTFIIPVSYDHTDRMENLNIVAGWLKRCFNTTIIIGEQGGRKLHMFGDKYISFPYKDFHRTRMLNRMTMLSDTPIVINWDADVLVPVRNIIEMVKMLREDYDFVYPYDGRFVRVGNGTYGRDQLMIDKLREGDVGNICKFNFVGKDEGDSKGGAIGYKKDIFIKAGMENEKFIAYTPEDVERYIRFEKLGYKIGRTTGCLYHLNHYCGDNSTVKNKYFSQGVKELERIKTMKIPKIKADTKEVVLISYADKNYEEQQKRLTAYAEESGMFDDIFCYSDEWLRRTDFYSRNKNILEEERGAGLWLWKPFIILETMKHVSKDAIILYLDSGDIIDGDIRSFLINVKEDILLTDGAYKNIEWTKRDCFIKMGCDEEKYHNTIQVEAGVIIVKNTTKTKAFITEWMDYCEDKQIISFDKSKIKKEYKCLQEHRNDQSILTNLKVKYNIASSDAIREFVTCNIPISIKKPLSLRDGEKQYEATDVTFIIPVKYDSQERKENLETVIYFLKQYFNTNIIVGEQGGNYFEYLSDDVRYVKLNHFTHHRSKMINQLTRLADTEIIFNWDADVIMTAEQLFSAIKMLRSGVSFVYPYTNFVRIHNNYPAIKDIMKTTNDYTPVKINEGESFGGAVGYLKSQFIEIGMENENIINWGYEDIERYRRMIKLGYEVNRIPGDIYHIEHPQINHTHPYLSQNRIEANKVSGMSKEALLLYIHTWKWRIE